MTRRRTIALIIIIGVAAFGAWAFWNRPTQSDMAAYVPADCVAFVESNDLVKLADHFASTDAWKALAAPIGASTNLTPNRWLVRLARWTGFGSPAQVILARSQVAVVFTEAQASESGTVLTVKPHAALVIETHTTQRRMRPVLEKAVEAFASQVYGPSPREQKQASGSDLIQWSSQDGSRHMVMAFVETTAIISNDESLLLRCIAVRRGNVPSLASIQQVNELRNRVGAANASAFGLITKSGIKPVLQAWLLSQPGASEDKLTGVRLFADTFGNLVDGLGWSSRFADGATEDHCFLSLTPGVADQMRSNLVPEERMADKTLALIPADVYSVSFYDFHDVDGFWRDLNTTISSHADALAAIVSRPYLRSLVKPYGIEDADTFARAIGPQFATVRVDSSSRPVLIAEAFDQQALHKLAQQRLGSAPQVEMVGDAQILLSTSDDWAVSFVDNHFLIGPIELTRRCLQARAQAESLGSADRFRKAQRLIDVSLPINAARFTDDRQSAISFVDLFSQSERPTFSTSAASVDNASRTLPYAVSVTILKDTGFDWTSRSSFGLLGSLFVNFAPEKAH